MTKLTPSKLARLEKGLSQYEVEAKTGIRQNLVSLYEREIRTPSEAHKQALSELYDKPAEKLWNSQ
jgi:transcriptional regulator with XRE-family HTH domain